MADGELTIKLDDDTARRLQAAADAAGRSVEDYAANLIAARLAGDGWEESRRRLAEYDQTGEFITVEEALAHFDEELETRTAQR